MQLFTGKQYLKIDIANNMGYDKLNYDERINKFDMYFTDDLIKNCSNKQLKELVLGVNPEEPQLVFAGLMAYRDTLNNIPTGYRVALDSCNSGSQLMSALTRDENGLNLTGMVTDKRMDLYTEVYKRFKQLSGNTSEIERKHIKKCIMTSCYGSKRKPEKVLGVHNIPIYEQTMEEMCPGVWELRSVLLECWDPDSDTQRWVMPDNFHVECPVEVKNKYKFIHEEQTYEFELTEIQPIERGISNVANLVHACDGMLVREMLRRCNYNKEQVNYVLWLLNQYNFEHESTIEDNILGKLINHYEESKWLSIRIVDEIHSIEDVAKLSTEHRTKLKEVLLRMVQYEPFEVVMIHDSFSAISNNLNYVRYWYNDMVANIVDSDLLQYLLNQISPQPIELNPQLNYRKVLAELVRNSSYGIC